jgi:hypothetical protein
MMKVRIAIDRRRPILTGRGVYGPVVIDLDPSGLSPSELEALAAAKESEGITDLTTLDDASSLPPDIEPRLAEADDPLAAARAWLAARIAHAERLRTHAQEETRHATELRAEAEHETADYIAYWRRQPAIHFIQRDSVDGTVREVSALPMGGSGIPSLPRSDQFADLHRQARDALASKLAEAREIIAGHEDRSAEPGREGGESAPAQRPSGTVV